MHVRIHAIPLTAVHCTTLLAQDAGPILLREGDALSNGWVAMTFLEIGVAEDCRWAALVDGDEPPNAPVKAIVVEGGSVLLAEGQVLPGGERIGALIDKRVDRAGTISTVLNVAVPPGLPNESLLFLGTTLTLETGEPVFNATSCAGSSAFSALVESSTTFPHPRAAASTPQSRSSPLSRPPRSSRRSRSAPSRAARSHASLTPLSPYAPPRRASCRQTSFGVNATETHCTPPPESRPRIEIGSNASCATSLARLSRNPGSRSAAMAR
ncbi:MAG: hypothetical protein AAF957_27230 [Planctomycetota bacterium]